MSKGMRTEDEVRDSAKLVLGFDKTEDGVQQGTGQITTFNQLGFRGCNDKPDGWYLPDDASKPAIILETKSEAEGVSKEKYVKELFKNIDVVAKKYSKTIGILYSGSAIRVFKNKIELSDASKRLEDKNYYICLCTSQKLDSNYIVSLIYEGAEGNQRKSTAKKQIPLICNVWPFTIWGGLFCASFYLAAGKI